MTKGSTTAASWRRRVVLVAALLAATSLAACGDDGDDEAAEAADETTEETTEETTAPAGPQELVGLFRIDAGTCADAGVTAGSWFRMVQGGGTMEDGPFVQNLDSSCGDKTWSPLLPGTDGGLRTGAYQPLGDPAFAADGSAASTSIIELVPFFAVGFGAGTNETDPQTGEGTTPPTITAEDGTLTGDLRAFAAAWNNQHFNQGAPKPDDSMPGLTSAPTGTYDEATGKYTLEWASEIVGGPFNSFTGVWHLEGTFESG